MKKTGTLLKDKRESAKLSISEVALATKINPKILTAIENGDETHLPAKTFLRGFLKAYALFLKMDPEEVLRLYQEETGGTPVERVHEAYKTDGSASTSPATRRRVGEENSSGMRTAAVVVIVLLIGLIIGVRELIEKYQREKVVESSENIKVTPLAQPPITVEVTNPVNEISTPSPMLPMLGMSPSLPPPPAPVPEVKPAVPAPKPAEPAKAPVEPPKIPPAEPAAKVSPPPAQNEVVQTPAPKALPPPEIVKKAETKPTAEVAPPPETPKPLRVLKNEIILEALDKVDVKFQIKGETKRLSLAPTQVHTIHSDQPVVLDVSDGGAVNIIVNGRDQGPPGTLGQPKQIKIP